MFSGRWLLGSPEWHCTAAVGVVDPAPAVGTAPPNELTGSFTTIPSSITAGEQLELPKLNALPPRRIARLFRGLDGSANSVTPLLPIKRSVIFGGLRDSMV